MKSLLNSLWKSITNNLDLDNQSHLEELKSNIFFKNLISNTLSMNNQYLTKYLSEVLKEIISANEKKLKKLIGIGIPNQLSSLRSLCWKILLGYLPYKHISWETNLEIKRQDYYKLRFEIISNLTCTVKKFQERLIQLNIIDFNTIEATTSFEIIFDKGIFNNQLQENEIILSKLSNIDFFKKILPEHQFRNYPDFKAFLEDYSIIDDINKDIIRTKSLSSLIVSNNIRKFSNLNEDNCNNPHIDILVRILFIYAKQNPSIGYVQGMNEIVSKVYQCYLNDNNFVFSSHLEADTYNSFSIFMSKIKNIYLRDKDFKINGIKYQLNKIKFILKLLENDIYICFEKNKLELDLFCFRWIAVIFAQDIEIPQIYRLWDFIILEEDPYDFLNFVCVAVLSLKKRNFLKLDITGILQALKNLKKLDIDVLIKTAFEIKAEFKEKKLEKVFKIMN